MKASTAASAVRTTSRARCDIAYHFDAIAVRRAGDGRLEHLLNFGRDLRRLERLIDIALYRDRGHAVTPPQDRILRPHFAMADLAERDHAPVVVCQGQVAEFQEIEALRTGASRRQVDRADILPDLSSGHVGKQERQCQVGGTSIAPNRAAVLDIKRSTSLRLGDVRDLDRAALLV
jgi:hypothetical protein